MIIITKDLRLQTKEEAILSALTLLFPFTNGATLGWSTVLYCYVLNVMSVSIQNRSIYSLHQPTHQTLISLFNSLQE